MHKPSGAAHTDIRVINLFFNVGTSFFARYGPVIVTNPAADFQVRRGEKFCAVRGLPPSLRRGHSTHDGDTTPRQHSVLGVYFPVSASGGP